jgi:molybdate transport system substrate-binding protein
VLVSAAASLTDAFVAMEVSFEAAHPDVDVVLNFGGSSSLREQILAGAPVDVFASANPSNMEAVVVAGETLQEPRVFASNRLQIAVPVGNPAAITGLEDFSRPELLIGLCAAAVPCGGFAAEVLDRADVVSSIDTREPDVRALLTKIEAGELDAGIVYVTDVIGADGGVEGVRIPSSVNVVATYPIAILGGGSNSADAATFIAYVFAAEGQAVLSRYGFGTP